MSIGKSVRLFLADGTPGGLLTAEIMNWTGHVIAAPRSGLAALLKRPEVGRTGVYILLGDDPASLGGEMTYIGEGDDVGKRLYQHGRPENQDGKDFWDRAIVLTSKDANLTKAHARYLESRFISLALTAKRANVANSNTPGPILLPEADKSDMEYYIQQAKIMLPVLGVNILRSAATAVSSETESEVSQAAGPSPTLILKFPKGGVIATAQEVDGEFTVNSGSTARLEWVGAKGHSYTSLRAKAEQDGTLALSSDGKTMKFTQARVFSSPSAAAAVVLGRNANGRTEWIVEGTQMTYGDWQQQGVEDAVRAGKTVAG